MWGRIDDKFHRNPKQLSMSDAAFRLWVLSWSYCLDAPAPTGFMTTLEAEAFARMHGKARAVAELVHKRGWESVAGGYLVHDLSEYLPPTSRERTRKYRDRKRRGVTSPARHIGDVTGRHKGVTDRVPVPVPVPEPEPEPINPVSANASPDPVGLALVLESEVSRTPAEQVFDAWLASTGRSGRTVLDEKRRRLIARALKSYPLEDLLDAVDGWRFDAHHRGENDRSRPYNDLELILRDPQHIERFRDFKRNPPVAAGLPASRGRAEQLGRAYGEAADQLRRRDS